VIPAPCSLLVHDCSLSPVEHRPSRSRCATVDRPEPSAPFAASMISSALRRCTAERPQPLGPESTDALGLIPSDAARTSLPCGETRLCKQRSRSPGMMTSPSRMCVRRRHSCSPSEGNPQGSGSPSARSCTVHPHSDEGRVLLSAKREHRLRRQPQSPHNIALREADRTRRYPPRAFATYGGRFSQRQPHVRRTRGVDARSAGS
jgi:hypothetical protein